MDQQDSLNLVNIEENQKTDRYLIQTWIGSASISLEGPCILATRNSK